METTSFGTLVTSDERRAQQRAIADAARLDLSGAWLAVRPRRRRFEVQQIGIGQSDSPAEEAYGL